MNADAYNAALRRLSVREYSSRELGTYLEKKGFSAPDVAAVLARLAAAKLLDDSRYVKMMVRYQAGRGKGPAYIRMKLKQKGVSVSTSELKTTLEEVAGKTELQSAREVVERRYPGYQNDRAVAARALQALLRRGFSFDVARQAVATKGLAGDESF